MSIGICKRENVPPGAKILTKNEIVNYYWNVIYKHKNENLKAPFYYGIPALACTTMITNVSLLFLFRRKLKIFKKGIFVMSGVCGVMPAVMSAFCHYDIVASEIFTNNCFTCAHLKSLLITLGFSFGYGLTVTPFYSILVAERLHSTRIPGFMNSKERYDTYLLFKSLIRRASTRLYIFFIINTCMSVIITGLEQDAYLKINEYLEEKNILEISE